MDFIPEEEINELYAEFGISLHPDGGACVLLEMDAVKADVRDCLTIGDPPCGCTETDGWTCRSMNEDALIATVIGAVRKIHPGQVVLVPSGKWRSVFDAVAFSMAEDEPWQEFDASATIKLNTRDPLLFESGDEHTLIGLITSLMKDGVDTEQSVFLIPAGAPLLMHIQPGGPVKLWYGNSVLADEISEAYAE